MSHAERMQGAILLWYERLSKNRFLQYQVKCLSSRALELTCSKGLQRSLETDRVDTIEISVLSD